MKEKQDRTLRFTFNMWVTKHLFVIRFHPYLNGTQSLRVSTGIAVLFLGHRHNRWEGGLPHAPAASIPGKDPVSIEQKVGLAGKNPVPTGVRSRTVQPVPQRLFRQSYSTYNAVVIANSAKIEIFTLSCNVIFKTKFKLFISSGSASPFPLPFRQWKILHTHIILRFKYYYLLRNRIKNLACDIVER